MKSGKKWWLAGGALTLGALALASGCSESRSSGGGEDDDDDGGGGASSSSVGSVGGGSSVSSGAGGETGAGGAGGTACIPSCADKMCGSDGCEGSCGTCEAPALCNASFMCEAPVDYPAGPYGIMEGDTIPNFELAGFPDASVDNSTLVSIKLEHFYNPTGSDVFPAGSPYGAGTPKPKALLFNIAATWAAPCNNEAATVLPPKYETYAPAGGEFLMVIIDGAQPNVDATPQTLVSWTTKHNINYPAAIDMSGTIRPLLEAYPTNVVVDPKTMKVTHFQLGVGASELWNAYESVLFSAP
jgi:hypothetical protein